MSYILVILDSFFWQNNNGAERNTISSFVSENSVYPPSIIDLYRYSYLFIVFEMREK